MADQMAGAPHVPPGRRSLAAAYERLTRDEGIGEAIAAIFNCNSLVDVVENGLEQMENAPRDVMPASARSTASRLRLLCYILRDELARASRGIDAAEGADLAANRLAS